MKPLQQTEQIKLNCINGDDEPIDWENLSDYDESLYSPISLEFNRRTTGVNFFHSLRYVDELDLIDNDSDLIDSNTSHIRIRLLRSFSDFSLDDS